MTVINVVNGDLLDVVDGVIAHGCNCQGVMGSGVAKAIRDVYPKAYDVYRTAYLETHKRYGKTNYLPLGDIVPVQVTDKLTVVNLLTQEHFGRTGMRYVSYDAIERAFVSLAHFCVEKGHDTVNIPLIGAGLGGGNWRIISTIIEEAFSSVNRSLRVNVVLLEEHK